MIQVKMDSGEISSEIYDLWLCCGVIPYFTSRWDKGSKRPLGLLLGPSQWYLKFWD